MILADPQKSSTQERTTARPSEAAFSVRTLETRTQIEALRSVWERLSWHPNSDLDFYLLINSQQAETTSPLVLVCEQNGTLEALLVGRVQKEAVEIAIGYKTLFRIRVTSLRMITCGRLGSAVPEIERALVSKMQEILVEKNLDLLAFRNIRVGSPIHAEIIRAAGFIKVHSTTPGLHWRMHLPKVVEDVPKLIDGDARREVRRRTRKLNADNQGQVEFRLFRDVSEVDEMMSSIEQVASVTYQRGLGAGFINDAKTREQLLLAARKQRLRAYLLYVKGKPCSFWMGELYGKTFFSGNMGYDLAYRNYSPGTLVLLWGMEQLTAEGVEGIDFGLGDAEYKRQFCTEHWEDTTVTLYGQNLRGKTVELTTAAVRVAKKSAESLLQRTNLLGLVKRIWRNRLIQNASAEPAKNSPLTPSHNPDSRNGNTL
jgi:hypothetical protein